MVSETGNEYFGNFRDGNLEGFGFLVTAKGNYYVGSFKDTKFHGKGEFYNSTGELKVAGDWDNGKPIKLERY